MQLTCPRCSSLLEYSGDRPSFCGYCGNALAAAGSTSESGAQGRTAGATDKREDATLQYQATPAAAPLGDRELSREKQSPLPAAVGGYRLLRELGRGGMGAVYEAEDGSSGRHVAVKLISPDSTTSPEAVERFRREGRLASVIDHPRCVFVLGADEEAGRPYIVMELMQGSTLKDLVQQKGPLPPQAAVTKILDVIDGLREAHRLGVIHRDVKPSNCFLEEDGRVKVGDFGLSKSLQLDGHLTRTGSFVGTPLFASPEQVRGETVDLQSDVYSVAATLYFLLTGRAPFQNSDSTIALVRIAADPAPPMRTLRPELPKALDEVVLRGLERDRNKRWRGLDEFRNALLAFVPGLQKPPTLGLRFGTFLLDFFIFMIIAFPIGIATIVAEGDDALDLRSSLSPASWKQILGISWWVIYWGVPESLWGCTLGKWLMGLRVRTAAWKARAGVARIALRLLSFYVLINLGNFPMYVYGPWVQDPPTPQDMITLMMLELAAYPLMALGIGVLVCTMRERNGYRGLHEFISGTRVVQLPVVQKPRAVLAEQLDRALTHAPGLPQRIGPFTIRGALRWGPQAKVLLGDDAGLERQVLIWLRPNTEPPLSSQRRDLTRPARLRWLAGGTNEAEQWDAFLAPLGRSLPDLISSDGTLPWPEVRTILEQLTAELTTAAVDSTLPASLCVDQIRVQSSGQLQLVDWPLRDIEPKAAQVGPDVSTADQALELVRQTVVLALGGQPWRPENSKNAKLLLRQPLPEHAKELLTSLLNPRSPYGDVPKFERELRATRDMPAKVTRARRAAHLTAFAALIAIAVGECMLPVAIVPGFVTVTMLSTEIEQNQQNQKSLEEGTWSEFAASAVNPDPLVRLRGIAQLDADLRLQDQLQKLIERHEREREARIEAMNSVLAQLIALGGKQREKQKTKRGQAVAATHYHGDSGYRSSANDQVFTQKGRQVFQWVLAVAFTVSLALWPIVWVLWAFLWRGGFSFGWMGLSLKQYGGRKAARWQCAWRALLLWAPLVALWTGSLWLEFYYWDAWTLGTAERWILWLSWGMWWLGLMLLPLFALQAVLSPERGLHDRLAGTYLVPR